MATRKTRKVLIKECENCTIYYDLWFDSETSSFAWSDNIINKPSSVSGVDILLLLQSVANVFQFIHKAVTDAA